MNKKYIVITRPLSESTELKKHLTSLGLHVFTYPTISFKLSKLSKRDKKILKNIEVFDWIVFTSKNGVKFFLTTVKKLKIDTSKIKKVAAVGSKTAEEVKKNNLPFTFTPSKFTTTHLGNELPDVKNKRILLPRTDIANKNLTKILKKRGGNPIDITIYNTTFAKTPSKEFEDLLDRNLISCITFTSPSTVKGLLGRFSKKDVSQIVSLPALSIGPVTTKTLKKYGFKKIYTADTFTVEGLVTKIKKYIL